MKTLPAKGAYILVAGCGRLGRQVAEAFSKQEHSVVAIDRDPDALEQLSEDFSGFEIVGDAADMQVLERARIAEADMVLALTGKDSLNLMVALTAQRMYTIKHIVARVVDPKWQHTFDVEEIETVCPVSLAASQIMTQLDVPYETTR